MGNDGDGEWTVALEQGVYRCTERRTWEESTWHLGQGCHCCLGVGWWPLRRAAAHSMLGTNPQFATGRRHGRATVAPIWGLLGGSNLGRQSVFTTGSFLKVGRLRIEKS